MSNKKRKRGCPDRDCIICYGKPSIEKHSDQVRRKSADEQISKFNYAKIKLSPELGSD